MGPGEVIAVIVLFAVLPAILVRGIAQVKAAKYRAGGETGGEALRKSELHGMIEEAVAEATAPLEARVAELEAQLAVEDGRIDPSILAGVLDADLEDDDAPAAVRRRQRA